MNEEALASLESYGDTLMDTCNKGAGVARSEIAELKRRIAALRETPETGTDADGGTDADPAEEVKPVNRMQKPELVALAEERGVTVPEGATVAELRELLGA